MKKTSVIICLLATIIAISALASRPINLPGKEELVGDWVGYDESYVDFYRLNLRADGTGSIVVLYPDGETIAHDLTWELMPRKLFIHPSQKEKSAEKAKFSVSGYGFEHIDIRFRPAGQGWDSTVALLNEKSLKAKIAASAKNDSTRSAQ